MRISREWDVRLDQAGFMAEYGHTFGRALRRPGMAEAVDATFNELNELVKPAVAWDCFPVREMRHEAVHLEGGRRIGNGPVTTVMGGAAELAIGVCTVGSRVSERITQLKTNGDPVQSLLLDQLATLAVGKLSQQFYQMLMTESEARGLHTSTYLSPGESEWSIRDQAVIFDLLDATQIGVSLTESMLMKPIKSVSLMAGIGPEPMGVPGATHCDYCTMADRCPYHGKHGAI